MNWGEGRPLKLPGAMSGGTTDACLAQDVRCDRRLGKSRAGLLVQGGFRAAVPR